MTRTVKTLAELKAALAEYREALEPAFSPDTALPSMQTPPVLTPSAGHCGAVAFLLVDLLGGALASTVVGDVSHWFNRFSLEEGAFDADLTGDQFGRPSVQVATAGSLYPATRLRATSELQQETVERARVLARRACLRPGRVRVPT